jgi:hypothetical protein
MEIRAPEFGEIMAHLVEIKTLLQEMKSSPAAQSSRRDLMTGPKIRAELNIGNNKLQQLVKEGKIERIEAYGNHPRYRIVERGEKP